MRDYSNDTFVYEAGEFFFAQGVFPQTERGT